MQRRIQLMDGAITADERSAGPVGTRAAEPTKT
jgi:hypothetical protein